jgi:hypothetical protein
MSNLNLRRITNSFQDVRLVSLRSWRQAGEISPRDHGGPYVVLQDGYDPEDIRMIQDEFVLGRSGRWIPLGLFYRLSIPDRRAEYIFGTAAEVMSMMRDLPSNAVVFKPPGEGGGTEAAPATDDMAAAIRSGGGPQAGR